MSGTVPYLRHRRVKIQMVSGVEGPCLCLDDIRIAGPKPWAGGNIMHRWDTSVEAIVDALPQISTAVNALDAAREALETVVQTLRHRNEQLPDPKFLILTCEAALAQLGKQ